MTEIGFIIQPGESIPADVTGVQGGAKSRWRLTSKGHWHLPTAQVTCLDDDCGVDGYALMRASGQVLTVTHTESVSGLCEVGDDRVTCIVADPVHRRIYHGAFGPEQPAEPVVNRAAHVAAGGMVADGCGWCQHHGYTPGQLLTAEGVPAEPEPDVLDAAWQPAKPGDTPGQLVPGEGDEPQPVDVLRLMRLYGDEREWVGAYTPDKGTLQRDKAQTALDAAQALYARIEAGVEHLRAGLASLTAVTEGLTKQRDQVRQQRDEAQTEVERMRGTTLGATIADRDEARAKLAESETSVAAMRQTIDSLNSALCTESADEALNAIGQLRLQIASTQADRLRAETRVGDLLAEVERLKAAQPDPSAPQVQARNDEGVALWQHSCHSITALVDPPAGAHLGLWCTFCPDMRGEWRPLLLGAPPREPRTWPKLDGGPKDLKLFQGASGELYMPWTTFGGEPTGEYLPKSKYDAGEGMLSLHTHSLSHWREVDGPLTEVFDEAGTQ